jgi:UPF0755 protein
MIRRTLLVLFLTVVFVSLGVALDYLRFLDTPIRLGAPSLIFEVRRGASFPQVAADLKDRGIVANPYYLLALARQRGDQGRLKAGEIELTRFMLPADLLGRLTSGRSIEYPITLVEGRTFRQAVAAILQDGHFGSDLQDLTDESLMAALGRRGEHPEGRFFPDTYRFPRHTTGLEVLRRAAERMDRVLQDEWDRRAEGLPLKTPYEALILASIVEKETAVPAERPAIAGVFVRRLQQGMRLQTDPTVIYGLGTRYDGNLRRADLLEATPYNTYAIQGLPPTPIALPGREAIHAALHPADGESLYFVARGDGTHAFSATLDQHNRAVREYQLRRPLNGRAATP